MKHGIDIKHMRNADMEYLIRILPNNLKREEIFKISNNLKEINYFKRAFMLKIVFEKEDTMCFFLEKQLLKLSKMKLSQMNPKSFKWYFKYKKVSQVISLINKCYLKKHNDFSEDKTLVNIIDIFQKMTFGDKIKFIEYLNNDNKTLYFNTKMKFIYGRIQRLKMIQNIRNHLSHQYWSLGNQWIDDILFDKNNSYYKPWNKSAKEFFDIFNKDYKLVHNNLMIDTHYLTNKNVKIKSKLILKKYKNLFFIL